MNHSHPPITSVVVLAVVSTPAIATAATPPVRPVEPVERIEPTDLSDRDGFESRLDGTLADQLERHRVPGAAVVGRDGDDDGIPLLERGTQRPLLGNGAPRGTGRPAAVPAPRPATVGDQSP